MSVANRCPVCGSTRVSVKCPSEYRYDNAGLSGVTLVGDGVAVTRCRECDGTATVVRDEQQLLQVLGLMIVVGPPGLRGEELRFLRALCGLTQAALAAALKMPRRETIAEWEGRERVFRGAGEEVFPRLVLLKLYHDRVIRSDHCFLGKVHRDEFLSFSASFADRILDLLEREREPLPLSVRHRPRAKLWAPEVGGRYTEFTE